MEDLVMSCGSYGYAYDLLYSSLSLGYAIAVGGGGAGSRIAFASWWWRSTTRHLDGDFCANTTRPKTHIMARRGSKMCLTTKRKKKGEQRRGFPQQDRVM